MTPDELLSTSLLADNGIREPLYVTAMRYAGIDITKEKRPAHVDSVVLNEGDRKRLQEWFEAQPFKEETGEREKLLEVKNLSFGYTKEHQTLHNVSLSIDKGEMVSIVGRNGAGKSTFSKLVCGFEDPDSGEILFHGKDLLKENIRHRAKYIGYVMQNPNQMISKTMIYEEVALSLQKAGMPEEKVRQKVEDTLKICGLYPFRNWPVSALSFGQKKRVTIASVLVQDPELIILDEPTSVLTPQAVRKLFKTLHQLSSEGVSILFISHKLDEIRELADRCVVLRAGKVVASVDPKAESEENLARLRAKLPDAEIFPVSAATLAGFAPLLRRAADLLRAMPAAEPFLEEEPMEIVEEELLHRNGRGCVRPLRPGHRPVVQFGEFRR